MINTISTVSFASAIIRPVSTMRFAILATLKRRAIMREYITKVFLGYFFLIDSMQMYVHFHIQTKSENTFFSFFFQFVCKVLILRVLRADLLYLDLFCYQLHGTPAYNVRVYSSFFWISGDCFQKN